MIERLGELPVTDLARADEDDRLHEARGGAEDSQAGAGVPRAGAGSPPRADHARMGEGGGHAVVLETARGIHALVLQEQPAWIETDEVRDGVGFLEDGLALADGKDVLRRREGEQIAEPPDAGEAQRI